MKKDDKPSTQSRSDHPIQSILVVEQPSSTKANGNNGLFGLSSSTSQKGQSGIASLILPLQKYTQQEQGSSLNGEASLVKTAVPFLRPERSDEATAFWQARPILRKKRRRLAKSESENGSSSSIELQAAQAKIAQLQEALAEKQAEVSRWEKVNNKLMAKLKHQK